MYLKINMYVRTLIIILLKLQITSGENVISKLKCFKGPFSIIYYNKETSDLIFTRDKIGRNSLLFHRNNDNIVISSVLGDILNLLMCLHLHVNCTH